MLTQDSVRCGGLHPGLFSHSPYGRTDLERSVSFPRGATSPVEDRHRSVGGGGEGVGVEEVHEGAVVEGCGGEGEEEDDDADDAEHDAAAAEAGLDRHAGMTHGGNHEEDAPENPADPEDGSGDEEHEGQEAGEEAVQARGERVEEMAAVELAAGDEIEGCDEEADPAGDQDGVWA